MRDGMQGRFLQVLHSLFFAFNCDRTSSLMAFHEFHVVVAVDTTFSATARALVKDFVEEVPTAHDAVRCGALFSRDHGVPPHPPIFLIPAPQ